MSTATSGYITFRPRARLLKLIGEELISDEVVAITELVKNAHDADASVVTVSFVRATQSDGEIIVQDDGCGMDLDTFQRGWMEPAGSTKAADGAKVTPSGRRVLGEKGVGRFAADKLGSTLELVTKRDGSPEVRAEFDWDLFDTDGEMLAGIKNRWETRPVSEIAGHGTILRIGGLREPWTERMFRRLSTRLARLQSPFGSRHGFSIRIETDEFPEYSGELRSTFLDRAPYTVQVDFDGADSLKVELNGKSRKLAASPVLGQLACGPVRIRLYAFDLETESISRVGPRHEVRAWLREWSGVSVYRDGFRIWPYGEPSNDWLRLDQRRVNNPVVCLSNNQVVGFVEISRDRNPELMDQTNREGLIQNQALEDLRRCVEHTFHLLEEARQRVRHPRDREPRGGETRVDSTVDALEQIATSVDSRTRRDIKRIVGEARATAEREHAEKRRLEQAYADLAAAGEAAIGIGSTVSELFKRLRSELPPSARRNPDASKLLEEISAHLAMLSDVGAPGSHKRRTMDVSAELATFRQVMGPLLASRNIAMHVALPRTDLVRVDINPHTFRRVLHILLSNSLDWLVRTRDPAVTVEVNGSRDECSIVFCDNGPGIRRELADKVFEPLFTTKEGARGMGLTIARALVEQNGGRVTVDVDGRRRGARIHLTFPRKRARATVHA